MREIAYRPDIDGLRAVAVTAVVVFHAAPERLTGGFVGVDVFFVISGFLITSLLVKAMEGGRFSLLAFYERRARRILPALVVVVLATLVLGALVLFPADYRALARSAAATALFASNVWFDARLSDYFADAAETAPLLHTWSLAVEEQFYIVAPLVLALAMRGGRRRALALMALVVALSLALSVATSGRDAGFAFYLPFTRAHELGLGALLALVPAGRLALPRPAREAAAATGLLMILAAVVLYDDAIAFPGAAALLPCLGTALVIAAGRTGPTAAGRLLSLRPIVFVGLVSYSWYLWHWPLLALARARLGALELPAAWVAAAVAGSFLLAVVSLHVVERPFRRPDGLLRTRRGVFAAAAAGLAAVVLAAGAVELARGLPGRFAPDALAALRPQAEANPADAGCVARPEGGVDCRAPADGRPRDYVVFGDSHAAVLGPALVAELAAQGLAGEVVARHGCPPLVGVLRRSRGVLDADCGRAVDAILADLARRGDAPVVVLHGRWALYAEGTRVPLEPFGPLFLARTGETPSGDPADNFALMAGATAATVAAIRATGRRVVLLGSVPEVGWNVPRGLARHLAFGDALPAAPDLARYAPAARGRGDAVLAGLAAADPGVAYVSLVDALCRPDCPVVAGATPLYRDDNHLALAGAQVLLARLGLAALLRGDDRGRRAAAGSPAGPPVP